MARRWLGEVGRYRGGVVQGSSGVKDCELVIPKHSV